MLRVLTFSAIQRPLRHTVRDLAPAVVEHVCFHLAYPLDPDQREQYRFVFGSDTMVRIYQRSTTITGSDRTAMAQTEVLIRQHAAYMDAPTTCPHLWIECAPDGATIQCTLCTTRCGTGAAHQCADEQGG